MDVSAPRDTAHLDLLPSGLRLAIMRLSRRLRQQAVGQITASQLSALTTVSKRGPLSLGEMAAIEQIAPPSMTRIAARLEETGLVERQVDRADRRIARLAITDAGSALLEETRTRRDLYLARRLQDFTDHERGVLADALPLLERLAVVD
jgi:DNA-binding MarR family transcriptional regulator